MIEQLSHQHLAFKQGARILVVVGGEIQQGSGKMSLSVIPLAGEQVTWSNGAPARP